MATQAILSTLDDHTADQSDERSARFQRVLSALTSRERQVAELIAHGLASKEVGAALGLSTHTVRRHTERVFQKLGVQNRCAVTALLLSGGRIGYSTKLRAGFLRLEE